MNELNSSTSAIRDQIPDFELAPHDTVAELARINRSTRSAWRLGWVQGFLCALAGLCLIAGLEALPDESDGAVVVFCAIAAGLVWMTIYPPKRKGCADV